MTLAEQLRNEINVERDLPWLREAVLRNLRSRGVWSNICDTHIAEIRENSSLPAKYFTPVCEWARREGLQAEASYNSYGVRSIKITL